MDWPVIIMVTTFVILLMMNVPIAISIGLATLLMFITAGTPSPLMTMSLNMYDGINKFALLAIPFFILSGMLMGRGGIATRQIGLGTFDDHGHFDNVVLRGVKVSQPVPQ